MSRNKVIKDISCDETEAFVNRVMSNKEQSLFKAYIGELVKASDDRGNDLSGYKVFIDNSGIKHTFKKHGNQKTEEARGQIAITVDDFNQLCEFVSDIQNLTYEGTKLNMDKLLAIIPKDDVLYFIIFELRTKRKELGLTTMYKRKFST